MFNRKKSKLLILFLSLIFLVIAGGCLDRLQGERADYIRYGLNAVPSTLDPARAADSTEIQLVNTLLEGLLRQKPDGTYENAMAKEWFAEDSGKRFVFKIRDAMWTGGQKVTAEDFVYAWKRALDPDLQSPFAYLFYDIKNAEGFHRSKDAEYKGKQTASEDLAVMAADSQTLVVELNKANPDFYKKLVHPVFFPVNRELATELGEQYFTLEKMAGNGPFVLKEYEQGQKYLLEKNKSYWDEKNVSLEGMTWVFEKDQDANWQLFQKGQLDLLLDIPQSQLAEGKKKGEIQTSPLLANYYYQFNTSREPLADKRIRLALSLALDRNKLVNEVLQGGQSAARGLIPQGLLGEEPRNELTVGSPGFDNEPQTARQLLAEAGFAKGAGFPELEMLVEDAPSHIYVAEYLQNVWETQLGIKVKVVPLNWEEKINRTKLHEYDLVLAGWAADYPDLTGYLEGQLFLNSFHNLKWSNAEYDSLIKKAQESTDPAEYMQILLQAESLYMEELMFLPLYDFTRVSAIKERLKGLYLPPAGIATEFKWAYTD